MRAETALAGHSQQHPLVMGTNQLTPGNLIAILGYTNLFQEDLMKDFIKVMKALSDSSRVKIVKMLQHKSMCVCEIQSALNLAQPTVSNHLKVLEDAGLVSYQKDGLWVNYDLADGSGSPYAATLLGNLRHWLQNDPEITRMAERLPSIRREDICKK
jgi:ArsR family transcriptional regulator, arsenate/arsenite/antimonite-responsive transcriptional repressor